MTLFEALSTVYARDADIGAHTCGPEAEHERAGLFRAEALRNAAATFGRWLATIREGQRRRAATRALLRLDDRLLADIGVSRSEIPYLVVHGLDARPVNENRLPALAGCG
ncbi:MAG: DUF1127 domain-containing protein [Alphaproteobacteria bacterium]